MVRFTVGEEKVDCGSGGASSRSEQSNGINEYSSPPIRHTKAVGTKALARGQRPTMLAGDTCNRSHVQELAALILD